MTREEPVHGYRPISIPLSPRLCAVIVDEWRTPSHLYSLEF
jgi:hypothetical protein